MTADGSGSSSSPPVGDTVELMHAGGREPLAEACVRGASGSVLVLSGGGETLDSDGVTVRWWDDRDEAWEVAAWRERFDAPSGETTLRLLGEWRPAVLRRAARVLLGRAPAELVTLGGDGRVVRRVQVLCLDLSTTGCRVTGTGSAPSDGDVVQVAASTPDVRVLVDARVVHVARVAFGGWQAGIEFLPHTAAERVDLATWRDSAAW